MKYEELNITNLNNSYVSPLEVKYINRNRHKALKNSIFGMVFLCLLSFNVLFIMDAIDTPFTNKVLHTVKSIFAKPTDELFDDDSEVFFVAWLLGVQSSDEPLEFVSPVKHSMSSKEGKDLLIQNLGNVVYATEAGKVSKLEYNDSGLKYMEITHASGVVSVYDNLDFVGVVVGDTVTKGQLIASSKNLTFSIIKGNDKVDIEISDGRVVLGA